MTLLIKQLLMAHHKWTILSCLALSAPIQHPLAYLVLRVLKLTLRMVYVRLTVANRPNSGQRQHVHTRIAQSAQQRPHAYEGSQPLQQREQRLTSNKSYMGNIL
jgi:hypothetical protein